MLYSTVFLSYSAILLVPVLILYLPLVQGHTRYLAVSQGEEDGLMSKSNYVYIMTFTSLKFITTSFCHFMVR